MNNFKIIFGTVTLVLFSFTLAFISSCKKKDLVYNDTTKIRPCDNVICLNGGNCLDGNCLCPIGYEGVKCEKKWTDKFVGNFIASDECYTGSAGFYDVLITPDPVFADKMNFTNLGTTCNSNLITAIVNPEKTSFIFPMQNACGDYYISGYGNISTNGNYINIYLKSRDSINHSSKDCSILLNRKP